MNVRKRDPARPFEGIYATFPVISIGMMGLQPAGPNVPWHGTGEGKCTGGLARYPVRVVTRSSQAASVAGPAPAEAHALVRGPGGSLEDQEWTLSVGDSGRRGHGRVTHRDRHGMRRPPRPESGPEGLEPRVRTLRGCCHRDGRARGRRRGHLVVVRDACGHEVHMADRARVADNPAHEGAGVVR